MSMLCSICHRQDAKYKCPACGVKTCSLECVKRHKKQAECSGAVDSTKFVSRDELQDNLVHLNRDYNFLTRVGRGLQVMRSDIQADKKLVNKRALQGSSGAQVKRYQNLAAINADPRAQYAKRLYNDAPMITKRQNTLVITVPTILERSRNNKSGYDKKEGQFKWTIEWIFLNSVGEQIRRFNSTRCSELSQLKDLVLSQVLSEFKEGELEAGSQIAFHLHDVLNKNNTTFIQLAEEMTLANALKDKVILEYPTIYVSFSHSKLKGEVTPWESAYAYTSVNNEKNEDNHSDSSDSDDEDSSSSEEDSESDSDSDLETEKDRDLSNAVENVSKALSKDIVAPVESDTASATDSDEAPEESLSKLPVQ